MVNDLVEAGVPKRSIDVFEIGKIYDYKAFKISPIKLYHDCENCGYRIFSNGEKAIYATDTEHLQGISAKDYDLYMVESNYQEAELQERINAKLEAGEYIYEYRVAKTHLSHEKASEWLLANMGQNSNYVFLHQHKERKQSKDWSYKYD